MSDLRHGLDIVAPSRLACTAQGRRASIDAVAAAAASRRRPPGAWPLALLAAALLAGGCSLRRLAVNRIAAAMAASGDVYASDDDPELVGQALPFALKTLEGLLAQVPDHPGLLLAASRGFTQYAYAWVQLPAERLEDEDWKEAERQRDRALRLYLRARGYALRGLAPRHPGLEEALQRDPSGAVAGLDARDLPFVYWLGASWGAAIALGTDRPALLADVDAVRALLGQALAIDEGFGDGALHEAFITLEALPEAMGGSLERARQHFERAVALSGGRRASPYVTYAESVTVRSQDRHGFVEELRAALAIDPDAVPAERLANRIAQRRARWLLGRVDDLFLEGDDQDVGDAGAGGGGAR